MKGYLSLTSFACALVIGAALHTGVALGGHPETPAFQAGAGVLSYSFFNLSGSDCTFTPLGATANPNSPGGLGSWTSSGNTAFFNNGNPDGSGGYVFYNNPDPINTSSSGSPPPFPNTLTLSSGKGSGNNKTYTTVISTETWQNWSINYPAMGDSWTVDCGTNSSSIATLASSGNSLQSGWYGSVVQSIPNASITPTGTTPFGSTSSSSQPCSTSQNNPCAAGFSSQGLNWNLDSNNTLFQNMGGLWSGINYELPANVTAVNASSSLNFSILPINFSAYVQAESGINFTDMTPNVQTYYTPIYGGHTAITVGDPFLVSSISAKILWFLATSNSVTLSDTTSVSTIASALSTVCPAGGGGGNGVFHCGSYEDAYVQWFVGSQSSTANYPGQPSAAANAYNYALGQASVPIEQETIWGKVFAGLADIAIGVVTAALTAIPGAGGIIAGGIAAGVGGDVMPDVNSAITNATQYSISGAPPNPTQAPVTYNDTFAATNLFGQLLSNMGVQSEINALNPSYTGSPSPLWSNYDIYLGNGTNQAECDVSATAVPPLGVTNNLMQGLCYDSEGNPVANGSTSSLPENTYTNVYAPSTTQTTTELSIWNAILSGTNITTNPSGYMVTGGSNQYPSFSPPSVVVNASTSSFEPNSILVNTSFNPNTGNLNASSIGPVNQFAPGTSTAPAVEPNYIQPPPLETYPPNAYPFSPTTWTLSIPNDGFAYIASGPGAGQLTLMTYCISLASDPTSNTTCTQPANLPYINVTNCVQDSLIATQGYVDISWDSTDPPPVEFILTCQPQPTPLTNVTLDYSQCTNDKWASGGVYAAITTPPNDLGTAGDVVLACACVPSYLDGPSASNAPTGNLLGGYVVGATSSMPTQKCPLPSK